MTRTRTQRYRLIVEFELQDRGDYAAFRNRARKLILDLAERWIGVSIDYIAIEKVKTEQIERFNQS